MRIYVAHNTYQRSGGEDAVVAAEADLLLSAGHEVTLGLVSNDEITGISRKMTAFLDAPFSRSRAEWIGRELERTRAQVLHVHNFFPLLTPAIHHEAARRGVAVVQTLHNYRLLCAAATFLRNGQVCELCLGDRRHWGVLHRCYRGSLPGSLAVYRMQEASRRRHTWGEDVHRFIALSEFARQQFIAGGLPANRVTVKPNFYPVYEGDLSFDRRGALFVGRLSMEKGVDVMLKAWHGLPDIPLTIVGDGPERARLEALAPANVTFTGSLPSEAVRTWMLNSAALVVPSLWYEGFPMVLVEAYSRGLPVAASRIGSLAELVVPGETGRLFDPGNAASIAEQVRALVQQPTQRLLAMQANIRRLFAEKYSAEVNIGKLLQTYAEAIDAVVSG